MSARLIYFLLLVLVLGGLAVLRVVKRKRSNSPQRKGELGEAAVRKVLKRLNRDAYYSLHDLLLPKANAGTAQIDHLVVSIFGVFVIETKNYNGYVYGEEQQANWTQMLGGRTFTLSNPIWQNKGHVKAVQALLEPQANIPIIPIVVFLDQAQLKLTVDSDVVSLSQLLTTIAKYHRVVCTPEQALQIVGRIEKVCIHGRSARKRHVTAIQNNLAGRELKIAAGVCPRCGEPLVDRTGKYGPFKGCSTFPACHFISKQQSS